MDLKRYSGNNKPFVYAVFSESDKAPAQEVLGKLCAEKCSVWYEDGFGKKARKRMEKSGTVLLFMTPAASADNKVNEQINYAVMKGLPVITVYLSPTELAPSQKLQLNTYQGLMMYSFGSEEQFYEKLLNSPALQLTSVTEAQKKAARSKSLLSWAAAVAAVLVIVFIVLLSSVGGSVEAGSLMSNFGYTGALSDISEIYIYATKTMDANLGASHPYTENGSDYIQLDETGERLIRGELEDISDFSQLKKLRALVFAGNSLKDISPLYSCTELELLDISCNPVNSLDGIGKAQALKSLRISHTEIEDIAPLSQCPSLERVYASCDMQELFEGADISFEVVFADHTWSGWRVTSEATYAQEGRQEHLCHFCGKKETATVPVIAHEHDWEDWYESFKPTYASDGEHRRSCKLCGETEIQTIPKLDLEHPDIDKLHPHIFGGKEEWGEDALEDLYGVYIWGVSSEYSYIFKKNGVVIDYTGPEFIDEENNPEVILEKTHLTPDRAQMGVYDPNAVYTLEVYGNGKSYIYTIKHKFD